ncbi:hypothetical protein SNE40_006538 [Patella caerulea]|uniref:Ionotropic glutamate receptor L-glutamate and glycine-binding domain-containing protein n=1 Tax=Patella caerulea TaxID=87958 RepID=A0AAN8K2V4_PATCE
MADTIDRYSNKTTNYRTASWWIILSPVKLKEHFVDFNLQNVVTLTCKDDHLVHSSSISKGHITLIDCLNHGDVSIKSPQQSNCSVDSLFPNIKYRYNKRRLVIGTVASRLLQTNVGERNQTMYTGLVEELTRLLAHHLNFTYTFKQPAVGQYGDRSNGGEWNGLVGQLHRQEVDIVITDLVITEEREQVIDFILPPFLASSWAALYKKGIDTDAKWIKIFRPFQSSIYLIILFTIVPVAMLLCVLTVHSNDLIRDERPRDHLKLQDLVLRLLNIIISLLGMLFIRGDGMLTKKVPVRILLVFFWIVPIVLAGIYVGNLTASLTDSKVKKPFNNLEELVGLTDWKWGIRGFGLYKKVMKESKNTMIKRLWNGLVEFNETDPSTFDLDINVHINKILKPGEQYVYIGADSKYQLLNQKDCNLDIIDHLYSYLPMAIAV